MTAYHDESENELAAGKTMTSDTQEEISAGLCPRCAGTGRSPIGAALRCSKCMGQGAVVIRGPAPPKVGSEELDAAGAVAWLVKPQPNFRWHFCLKKEEAEHVANNMQTYAKGCTGATIEPLFAATPQVEPKAWPVDRETLGRMVREAWVRWAKQQPAPKRSWLLTYDELPELDKEADRQIGETMFLWSKMHIEAAASLALAAPVDHPEVVGDVAQWQVWVEDGIGPDGWVNEDAAMIEHWLAKGRKVRPLYAALQPSDSPALEAGVVERRQELSRYLVHVAKRRLLENGVPVDDPMMLEAAAALAIPATQDGK